MLSCKDICEKSTEHLEGSLSLVTRLQLRLHLLICSACRRFYRQFKLTIGTASQLGEIDQPTDDEINDLLEKLSQQRQE